MARASDMFTKEEKDRIALLCEIFHAEVMLIDGRVTNVPRKKICSTDNAIPNS